MTAEDTPGTPPLSASAARVAEELRRLGLYAEIRELPSLTRTAPGSGLSLGCA